MGGGDIPVGDIEVRLAGGFDVAMPQGDFDIFQVIAVLKLQGRIGMPELVWSQPLPDPGFPADTFKNGLYPFSFLFSGVLFCYT